MHTQAPSALDVMKEQATQLNTLAEAAREQAAAHDRHTAYQRALDAVLRVCLVFAVSMWAICSIF